ncbi:hypothetical protein [Desulfonema magnum]|uniref:Uncharacterized protein n=1 Tax=Desulfonema magnum TaxID=45655 RepID=A0A975GK80_9BACT|nr:hypothetical protein [Desulfonema magnum]QTA84431.1 Uncharacterized protein dnm_004270 [Desulfonema magnum]
MARVKNLLLFFPGLMIVLSGCVTTKLVDSFGNYTDVHIEKAEFSPTAEEIEATQQNKLRVVVIPPEDKKIVKDAELKEAIVSSVEKHLTDAGVEVVTQSLKNKLQRSLVEFQSAKIDYKGPTDAHYAVICSVNSVDLNSEYVAASKDKDGKQTSGPSCKYTARFKGMIKIYNIMEKRIIESVELNHLSLDYRDTSSSSCKIGKSIYELARSAASDAVDEVRTQLQNFFSPKGYILAKKVNEDKRIFRISLGRHHNLKQGQHVDIYTKQSFTNELTDEISIDEVKIAEGKVTDYIDNTFAWISVSDAEKADKVKLGDYVKISYKLSLFEQFSGVLP